MSPLTSMNSEVGFSVTIGLLMGMGRTITQKSELWRNTVLYLGTNVKGFSASLEHVIYRR